MALTFYDSGSFQATSENVCSVSHFAAIRCILNIKHALYTHKMDFITFPMTREKQDDRACRFARIAGFLRVQGAIDYAHVALRVLFQNAEVFRYRKRYRSLNMQLVCDHTQCILTVNAHYPEGEHCALTVSAPTAWPRLAARGQGIWPGHRSNDPLRIPTTEPEERYDESHAATHNIRELAIGVLKQRFRCLDCSGGSLQYFPQQVSLFIVVCCMLHNLALMRAQALPVGITGAPSEVGEEEEGKQDTDDVPNVQQDDKDDTGGSVPMLVAAGLFGGGS
uniref:putative nuclease HARBI1 n=1 Tax=Pristiophorus japonicus TaxID=55135 RepID=UPI00398EB027